MEGWPPGTWVTGTGVGTGSMAAPAAGVGSLHTETLSLARPYWNTLGLGSLEASSCHGLEGLVRFLVAVVRCVL